MDITKLTVPIFAETKKTEKTSKASPEEFQSKHRNQKKKGKG